jgi:hypothetical protein
MIKKLCFEIEQLGNMDEAPLTFDVPTYKTVDVKGAKKIIIQSSRN